jgi:hypothetical protein
VGDDYVPADVPVAFIKIDAEGYEVPVLKGFAATLRRSKPIVHIEILPIQELERGTYSRKVFGQLSEESRLQLIAERRNHAAAIRDILQDLGYAMCRLRGTELLPYADVMESNYAAYDYLAVSGRDLAVPHHELLEISS